MKTFKAFGHELNCGLKLTSFEKFVFRKNPFGKKGNSLVGPEKTAWPICAVKV